VEEKGMFIKPIAHIETDFKDKFGIPRQSGRVKSLKGKIVFLPEYRNAECLRGIEGFSHIWLLFDFSKAHREKWSTTVRPPRLGGNKKVGVFASRSPFRPNSIGLSSVKLEEIIETEKEGTVLIVSGIDLLDGTPIYDIKPYLPFSDCHTDATSGYAGEHEEHHLNVNICEELLKLIPKEKRKAVIDCLAEDPRPSYQEDGREYKMKFGSLDIVFSVKESELTVTKIICKNI
jgi:tRNA-Thr(GGU) m(6)t(6)A37 methyltransferase TsaA